MLDATAIQALIPHRYPFLLVDRIVEIEVSKRIVGIKQVTMNEHFFAGHFPGHPVMPGVLIVEALAQTGAVLLFHSKPAYRGKIMYFAGIESVRFKKPVLPGDTLRLEVEFVVLRSRLCKMHGVAKVDGEVATEADMTAVVATEPGAPSGSGGRLRDESASPGVFSPGTASEASGARKREGPGDAPAA